MGFADGSHVIRLPPDRNPLAITAGALPLASQNGCEEPMGDIKK